MDETLRLKLTGPVATVTLCRPDFSNAIDETLAVNLTGSFLIGLIFSLAAERGWLSPDARLLALIGFLGAYTTFSTFSIETVLLLRTGEIARALLNIGANNLFCLLGAWLGLGLPGLLWR